MRYLLFLFVFISSITLAQNGINYQGAATDSDGAKLVDQNISLRTSVLQGGVDGTTSYSETHNTTTDQFGLFNVVIGQGEVISGAFDNISWGADAHFLKVELDATGGSDYSLVSTTQMMSVPYAFYAENAGLDSLELTEYINNSLPSIYLECVEMGISDLCGGLGVQPDNELNPDVEINNGNYTISPENYLQDDNYTNYPQWRKFKINGLRADEIQKLMFRYKTFGTWVSDGSEDEQFVTPEIINNEVFFYTYAICASTNTNSCDQCCNDEGMSLTIPTIHGLNTDWVGGNYNSYSYSRKENIEIYFVKNNTLINSGILFTSH